MIRATEEEPTARAAELAAAVDEGRGAVRADPDQVRRDTFGVTVSPQATHRKPVGRGGSVSSHTCVAERWVHGSQSQTSQDWSSRCMDTRWPHWQGTPGTDPTYLSNTSLKGSAQPSSMIACSSTGSGSSRSTAVYGSGTRGFGGCDATPVGRGEPHGGVTHDPVLAVTAPARPQAEPDAAWLASLEVRHHTILSGYTRSLCPKRFTILTRPSSRALPNRS